MIKSIKPLDLSDRPEIYSRLEDALLTPNNRVRVFDTSLLIYNFDSAFKCYNTLIVGR